MEVRMDKFDGRVGRGGISSRLEHCLNEYATDQNKPLEYRWRRHSRNHPLGNRGSGMEDFEKIIPIMCRFYPEKRKINDPHPKLEFLK